MAIEQATPTPLHNHVPPVFELGLRRDGSRAVVVVCGDVDVAAGPRLAAALSGAFELADDVLLDLGLASFIDSTGLREVVRAWRRANEHAARFAILPARDAVMRPFATAGLLAHLPFETAVL